MYAEEDALEQRVIPATLPEGRLTTYESFRKNNKLNPCILLLALQCQLAHLEYSSGSIIVYSPALHDGSYDG